MGEQDLCTCYRYHRNPSGTGS